MCSFTVISKTKQAVMNYSMPPYSFLLSSKPKYLNLLQNVKNFYFARGNYCHFELSNLLYPGLHAYHVIFNH